MPPQALPRKIHLPPPGRPNWSAAGVGQCDLLYLSWGRRRYGSAEVPVSLHEGWTYFVVLAGTPRVTGDDQVVKLRAGDAIVLGPDRPYGLTDEPKAICEIVSWIWKNPPSGAPLKNCLFRRARATTRTLDRLSLIHRHCRDEVQQLDASSAKILAGLRLELDGLFERVSTPNRSTQTENRRLHLALKWLQRQIATPDPVQSLCDYLQVSPSTLNRLFHDQLGENPKNHIHRLRMSYALKLRSQLRLKEIAAVLGYKHTNDLSRALSKFKREAP